MAMGLDQLTAESLGLKDLLALQEKTIQQASALHAVLVKHLQQSSQEWDRLSSLKSLPLPCTSREQKGMTQAQDLPQPEDSHGYSTAAAQESPQPEHQPVHSTSHGKLMSNTASKHDDKATGLGEPLLTVQERKEEATAPLKHKEHSHKKRRNRQSTEIFPNADLLKRRLLDQLHKPVYSVETLYSETGFFQALARSENFQNAAVAVILLNVVWIAVDTDYNKADVLCQAPLEFQVVNNLFCIAFTAEIFVRLMAFRNKCDCFQDGWFVFDATLVILMVWETWIEVALYLFMGTTNGGNGMQVLRLFRILRLTRVARLARLLRHMPELTILMKGMAYAVKSVGATLVLLCLIIYVFAIFFTQQLAGTEAGAGCFDSVPQAAHCLLMNGVFSEEREFIEKMLDIDWIFYVVTLLYLLLASTTVMNMLIGVLCEVIAVTAKVEHAQLTMDTLRQKVKQLLCNNENNEEKYMVTKADFLSLLDRSDAMEVFASEDIDMFALVDCASIIFRDRNRIPFGEFMQTILQFRGENTATVKDVVNMRISVTTLLSRLEEQIQGQTQALISAESGPIFEKQVTGNSSNAPSDLSVVGPWVRQASAPPKIAAARFRSGQGMS